MANLNNLEALFEHHLQELLSIEQQLVKALPAMAKHAHDSLLKMQLETYLEQTNVHLDRLKKIFDLLNLEPGKIKSRAMKGLIKQEEELLHEKASPETMDAGLIAATQCIAHYKISAYGTSAHFAERLGHLQAAKLLHDTLSDEQNADTRLNELAKNSVNIKAL
ncbi:MAG: DUF892 family protein [Hymenobacteraceae bacterium]|nr:DUF892 family protein [Hymenobacteraceae bacterium]MDX5395442.1 DUF892 family protein [Hymenobacteraceae bacterium]MDX5511491.1 DUF892 family protein [Hymenobacteraceae bacterium]